MSVKEFSYNGPGHATAQLRHLTIRQLRSLAALSAKGSVTAASGHLGLTQ
ncbi:LysR family transcriptional regulator, partial [Bradyrhizobium sp. SHOUNA76]|nr:LysR family transcriptional regulator [Bradyrhizobium sp. SHOUNA76]MCJ9736679.1 LysR family transcriptional regulator [Bradyrhizobium sp. PRIMUS42]